MCRWIVYFGNEVSVNEAIGTHGHGLVTVAKAPVYTPYLSGEINATENDIIVNHPENGDGFGIGFYNSDYSLPFPAVLRDCKPIWHSNNLGPIAGGVKSPLVFGHVRKAFDYGSVAEQNCHPFCHGVYMFMHNGVVIKFHKVRASVLGRISEIFDSVSKDHNLERYIKGTTDSEALFFLILAQIAKLKNSLDFTKATCTAEELKSCMQEAIKIILGLVNDKIGNKGVGSRLNLALTDGFQVIVTRFRNARNQPPSLYYTLRKKDAKTLRGKSLREFLSLDDENKEMSEKSDDKLQDRSMSMSFGFSLDLLPQVVMIASEPVHPKEEEFWKLVPGNHILSITKNRTGGLKVESEIMSIPQSLYMTPDL